MVDYTHLDMAIAVSLAESNGELSDNDLSPAESNEKFSDDDYMPSILSQERAFNICPSPKKQRTKKKPVRKDGEKENGLVAADLSGHGGRQKKVRKKQITKNDPICSQICIINDSDSVKRTTSVSMAELDTFRFKGRANASFIEEAVPILESELRSVGVSAEMPGIEYSRPGGTSSKDAREECLVIDIDTDEVVELSDDTQFSVLLRLCGEECAQDEGALDNNSVPAFQQSPKSVPNREGGTCCDSVEGLETTKLNMLSADFIESKFADGCIPRELIVEETQSDNDEAQLPIIQEENDFKEQSSQDCEDFISSMMTQKCISQPEEVKAPYRISPSPLQSISNLPARLDTSKRRVIQMKNIYQAANRKDTKSSALERREPTPFRGSIVQVLQPGESTELSENHCSNKENVDDSPCGIILGGHPSISENEMECSGVREDYEAVLEDVLVDSGEAMMTIKCPICGENISRISVEERSTHTNSCLDKLDAVQGSPHEECDGDGPSPGPTPDQVGEWLEKLNLSRYASLFVEQEIDWDTLPWLTEEDLMVMGISAIGPRRKLFQAIQDLKGGSSGSRTEPQNVPLSPSPTVENTDTIQIPNPPADSISRIQQVNGGDNNNLITNYFPLPPNSGNKQLPDKSVTNVVHRTGIVRNRTSKRPRRSVYQNTSGIPAWMCIPGTPFRVDAFQHLSGECSHWFLTHFHTDHYQGLTRGFRYGHIFCSSITARLVHLRIGVSMEKLMIIPLNAKVKVAGVDVTFIDANHCPGAVMILFEPPNGEAVLHTGDFRFCPEMANDPLLQTSKIHTLVLDTTYCDPQYDFPTQETVIRFVIDAIQAEMFNSDTLFLIGTYTIGKERVFLEVAKALEKYVYVGAAKKKLLDCMDLSANDTKWITSKEYQSFIHVVPLWSISSFKRMECIARHYQAKYKLIVAFSPSGWSFGRGKKKTPGKRWRKGTMIRYEVPYSEHCSFSELKEFLKFIGPEDIIPSVPGKDGVGADEMIASLWSEDQ